MPKEFVLSSRHEQADQGEQARHGELTISDLARGFGVSLRTLRYYEDKGLLHPRREGMARFYSAKDRVRLTQILKGKRLGFTLAEIYELIASRASVVTDSEDLTATLGPEQIAAQIEHLARHRQELEAAIEELRIAQERMLKSDR